MSVRAAYKALMEGGPPSREDVIMQGMCKEWIWEFLLKHCSNSRLLRALAVAYPLPDSSLHLKRFLLLKSLSFDLSEKIFTDRTVETTSVLSSLYRSEHRTTDFQVPVTDRDGKPVLYQFSLWMLHLAVRVECTMQHLRAERDDWPKFCESLEKHWGNVAEDTEELEHKDDEDDEDNQIYMQLKKELWDVRKQPELRHDLLKRRKQEYVVRMMERFLDDAWTDVGLVFLEGVAQNLKEGMYVPDGFSLDEQPGGVLEAEKSSPVKPIEVFTDEGLLKGLQKASGSAQESVLGGQTDVESLMNVKHARKSSLGCTAETGVHQLDSLLPRKRKIPASLQKIDSELKSPSFNRDVLQADKIVPSRLTRFSSLVNKAALSGDFAGVDGPHAQGRKSLNIMPSEVLREKDTCAADAGRTRPRQVQKQSDEVAHDLEEEELGCLSPPPWAGSPGLNEGITARKRPILAPLCSDMDKTVAAASGKASIESPLILKAQIELKDGQASLNAVVHDPLPEAFKIAEEAAKISGLVRQARKQTTSANGMNQGMQPSSENFDSENLKINTAQDRGAVMPEPHEKRRKKSIMDRNPTAHTVEWETSDDITDSSDDRSPSNSRHVRLQKFWSRQSFAQQGGVTARNGPRRRKFRRWNLEEENLLRKEVERYGKGHWKHILQKHKVIFEGRTEVDLKDKWRNIERREGIS